MPARPDPLDHSDEHVDLPEVDAPGPPETAPHPLGVDEEEAARGLEAYRAVDDLDDDSNGLDGTEPDGGAR